MVFPPVSVVLNFIIQDFTLCVTIFIRFFRALHLYYTFVREKVPPNPLQKAFGILEVSARLICSCCHLLQRRINQLSRSRGPHPGDCLAANLRFKLISPRHKPPSTPVVDYVHKRGEREVPRKRSSHCASHKPSQGEGVQG